MVNSRVVCGIGVVAVVSGPRDVIAGHRIRNFKPE